MNATVEPKVWSHTRDVTVKFPGSKHEHEQLVTFRVEQKDAKEFQKIFDDYLAFCKKNEAIISLTDEVSDAESKEPCAFTVLIEGSRAICGSQMQRIGNDLLKHSKRVR